MNLNKVLHWGFGAAIVLTVGDYTVAQLTPWRMALLSRLAEYRQGLAKPHRLESYVPSGVAEQLNLNYEAGDPSAALAVFYPATIEKTDRLLPTTVWVHGGSWISGSKDYIANNLKIVAAKGFTTVGVNYTLAPENTYPAPVRQVNEALAYIGKNLSAGNVDPFGPQSHLLAEIAAARGIPIDSLFFADDYSPPLPHEYQFDLGTDAAHIALQRSVKFLMDRNQDSLQ